MVGLDFSPAIGHLRDSIAINPELAGAIQQIDLGKAALNLARIAEVEARAYTELGQIV